MEDAYRVNLVLTAHLVKEGKARAIREGTSLSAVVRGLLAWWLDERLPTPSAEPTQLSFLQEQLDMPEATAQEIVDRVLSIEKRISILEQRTPGALRRSAARELVPAGQEI